jgi:uncharacterized protein DUF1844
MEGARKASDLPLPGGNFHLFVSRLSIQAMISLGILENPLTKKKTVHPGNARMLVEDLRMLREKTDGNLDGDEKAHLDKVIGDLVGVMDRMEERASADPT